jgi:hypothetical protein
MRHNVRRPARLPGVIEDTAAGQPWRIQREPARELALLVLEGPAASFVPRGSLKPSEQLDDGGGDVRA